MMFLAGLHWARSVTGGMGVSPICVGVGADGGSFTGWAFCSGGGWLCPRPCVQTGRIADTLSLFQPWVGVAKRSGAEGGGRATPPPCV